MQDSMSEKGYLCLVLHAHLPFVRHPEEKYFLEENWLFEAITETYIPLLMTFEKLVQEGINFRLTLTMTPPLISMLKDELLQSRYLNHLNRLIELSNKEIIRTAFDPSFHQLAIFYHEKFKACKHYFEQVCDRDLVDAFKKLQQKGVLEIITCTATHGFLPILNLHPEAAKAQIQIGIDYYRDIFKCDSKGFWFAECGFVPGLDEILAKNNIKYFFVDSHGIIYAEPTPRYGVYAPIFCPSGVAAFGRDAECSKQVWSREEGYPGDSDYREYYRDIGMELDLDYLKPYIHPIGLRVNTGIKYWRITGKMDEKEVYRPEIAKEKAAIHAGNFMYNREQQINFLASQIDRKPIILALYDAELYGHWWYEGPQFLEYLIRKIYYDQKTIKLITPSDYLQEYSTNQMSLPSCSSWGYKGYSEYWLDKSNSWIYRHIHKAQERMLEMVNQYKSQLTSDKKSKIKTALHQAARELLLAESSDWPFIMKAGTMVEYANKRVTTHIGRFSKIYEDVTGDKIDEFWLKEVMARDNIFLNLNCANYYMNND